MRVTLQFFDGCPNCGEAESHLETLRSEGFELVIEREVVDTPEKAERLGFRGSPTILVDGADPFASPEAPVGLSCRMYATEAGVRGSPSLQQIRAAIGAAR